MSREREQTVVATDPRTEWPIYWFAVLDTAVESGDHQVAAEAQKELERLGVEVRYARPGQADQRRGQRSNSRRGARS